MLDRFDRHTVEAIRNHDKPISVILHDKTPFDDGTTITLANGDKRLAHDIALAVQGYYQRRKDKRING